MRKTLLLLYLISSSFIVFGQSVRLEFKAGVSVSNQSINTRGMAVKSANLIGFHAGGLFNIDVVEDELSIQPGLFYSNKGYQYNQALSDGSQSIPKPVMGKIQLNYLEAPVNVLYKFEATRKINGYFGGGGYVGYGLSGTYAVQSQKADVSFSKSIEGYQYKNPDYGVNAIVGAELSKHVVIEANYSLGLNNLSYYQSSTINNRSMGLSIGYLF
jgi:hypothetical protein